MVLTRVCVRTPAYTITFVRKSSLLVYALHLLIACLACVQTAKLAKGARLEPFPFDLQMSKSIRILDFATDSCKHGTDGKQFGLYSRRQPISQNLRQEESGASRHLVLLRESLPHAY